MATCRACAGKGKIACIQCYGSGRHGSDPNKSCAYCQGKKLRHVPNAAAVESLADSES
jgi:hypothetical protein